MKAVLFSIILSLAFTSVYSQVGFNNPNPDNSSLLDLKSTNKGLLIPRMSTLEKTNITSPATGLLVYDTDMQGFQYYNGTSWQTILNGTKTTNGVQLGYNLGIGTAPLASTSLTLGSALSGTSATFSSNVSMANLTASGTASITGNTTISGTLGAGNTSITGTLAASGNTTLSGTLSAGASTVNGPLTVNTTTGAFVLPRLTTAQRDALVSPVYGSMIYNTSTNKVQVLVPSTTGYTFSSASSSAGVIYLNEFTGMPGYNYAGTSFTVSTTGWISSIDIRLEDISGSGCAFVCNDDYVVKVCTGDGIFNSTVVATSNIRTINDFDDFNLITFNLPTPLNVTAGQTYTFWIENIIPGSNDLELGISTATANSNKLHFSNVYGSSTPDATKALNHNVYGTIPTSTWIDIH